MSAPLIPNKSCYAQLQDNRSEIKNNNESIVNVGDTNANQIVTKVRTTEGDIKKHDLTDESGNIYSRGSEKVTHLNTEQNKLLTFKDSQTCHTGVQESKLPSTTSREIGQDCRTSEAKDISRHNRISRGQSLSNLKSSTNDANLEVSSKGDVDFTQNFSKGKMPRTVEMERIKRLSLGRPSKLSPQSETFAKDCVGRVSCKRLLSASLDSIDRSHHLIGNTEKSQKTSTDHFLGMVFHPLDNTSEENTVFYSKPSTSGNKKISKPENVPNVNVESTLHTSHSQHSAVKPNEIASKSEAQLGQGNKSKKLELKTAPSLQSKTMCQQKIERIMLVEFLGCSKDENTAMQEQKGSGSDASKFQASHFQDACNKVEDPFSNQVVTYPDDKLLSDNVSIGGEGRGSNDSGNRATSQAGEEYFTDEEVETIFPLTCSSKSSGKVTPRKKENLHEVDAGCAETVGEQICLTHNTNLPDSKPLKANENKLTLVKGSTEDAAVPASDLSDQHGACSAETVSNQQPDNHDSDAETLDFSVPSKKTANAQKHLPEEAPDSCEAPESCNVSAKADAFLCVPTPVRPVAALDVNSQPTLSNSSLKDLYALHVDKLSPSSVLPPIDSTQLLNISPKVPIKTACSSAIPKPILVHSKGSLTDKAGADSDCSEKLEESVEMKPAIPRPKPVRPKIITYIRRNPRSIEQLDPSFAPAGLPFASPACGMPISTEQKVSNGGEAKPTSILYDKFKPDLQKPRLFSSGLVVSGIRPPGHHFGPMSEKFLQEVGERPAKDEFCPPSYTHYEVPPSFYRSAMILKPQLGLGAVSRLPSAKSRILIASQRSSGSCLHQQGEITSAPSLYHPDASVDLKKGSCPSAAKSNLPKPCQSGLRPPGYSRLPAAKLAAFGFVRSSSVSSVSSNQSNDSAQSDQSRTTNRSSFGNEEQTTPKVSAPSKDVPKGSSKSTTQVLSSTAPPRRSLLPAPKTATAPAGLKKEVQKDQDANRPAVSSPKRSAVTATKLHSPGHTKQRPATPKNGFSPKPGESRDAEKQFVQRLKEKCDEQSQQLSNIRDELKRASCGFDVFAITTQHFFRQNENALVKIKELGVELAKIRNEVALNTVRWKKLQSEKEELERCFEEEVKQLCRRQQEELQVLEQRLQEEYNTKKESLQEQHRLQLEQVQLQHQDQVEDITAVHEAAMLQLENNHLVAITVLQDENDCKIQELTTAHKLEKAQLEENFEKLRLSLQDQIDTLTFQNQSLKAKADRFEEALKKNTEEQLKIERAPYLHLEKDLKSLKHVLEMKNHQIHEQEKMIMKLEKQAEKNLKLEEKITMLQQQNEELRARIEQNTVITRQLSEENANLQEYVEKEVEEKKKLSRTNEELLWKLQEGDAVSPVKLPPTSSTSFYRCSSGNSSPAKVRTLRR
ncbi:microtubule-associated tumor suppressor candidate 2 isoform X1 [Aquila chrysaetos chrysaetos]|uniref:Microtubule associated scaffold protein 2 n=24 Tax=Neoaves TaxID=3078114 RepID=A0A663FDQ6_AQUCH|nr:microtubule-associated tumor suppressor candidate 2 isoform X1 [Aquila chrysaetos chrysaetos]XP_029898666.1 microtubule-associated tumor suppressor candidate 2 isoform X1 [Aquila chrysaetos chrysaetos]XP_029898667.1 microtubule-associated tumor suppressor candidate 2 isoform X1 [Aquila chrysaetos chrysaetos]XP_029898668.1 microtubule-associated tumor suppressor candidate 2 isoform X1 [Aquila chrysaetos chrysaetos]XP_029898669.1 microtubule-associated tumor suppressor candidate 2 isoform X1 [